jgi:hypothetical protein
MAAFGVSYAVLELCRKITRFCQWSPGVPGGSTRALLALPP